MSEEIQETEKKALTKITLLPFHTYHSEADLPELPLPELIAITSQLLDDNQEWNKTQLKLEDKAPTRETPFVAQILSRFEKAQEAYQNDDFSSLMENVFAARLILEKNDNHTNIFFNGYRSYGLGMLLRRICKRLAGSCLDYAGALHKKNPSLPKNLTLSLEDNPE